MQQSSNIGFIGLNVSATGNRIGQFINESGLCDKEIGAQMGLTVQSINKWRHGRSLPDIENLFILSRILGKKVDDFLVPVAPAYDFKEKAGQDPALNRLIAYSSRLSEYLKNHSAA